MGGLLIYSKAAKEVSNLQNIYEEKVDALENINYIYIT